MVQRPRRTKYRAQWRMEHSLISPLPSISGSSPRDSTTRNGVSGLKLHYYQFAQLPQIFGSVPDCRNEPRREIPRKSVPECPLHLADPARQGAAGDLGKLLASRTEEWWRIGKERPPGPAAEPGGQFRPRSRPSAGKLLHRNDGSWQAFFRTTGSRRSSSTMRISRPTMPGRSKACCAGWASQATTPCRSSRPPPTASGSAARPGSRTTGRSRTPALPAPPGRAPTAHTAR